MSVDHMTIVVGVEPDMPFTMWQAARALRGVDGYAYVGTVYSRHEHGIHAANWEASLIAGYLMRAGIPVFSPIAHTHGIAMAAGIDPIDHAIWMPLDRPMMDGAALLVVAMMDGWAESKGIGMEIEAFRQAGKSVVYVDPNVDGWLKAEREKPLVVVDPMRGLGPKDVAA